MNDKCSEFSTDTTLQNDHPSDIAFGWLAVCLDFCVGVSFLMVL
jgi:hypothetical protein